MLGCRSHSLLLVLGNLLDRRAVRELLIPRMEIRVLLCDIRRLALRIRQQPHDTPIPRHKRQVRKGAFLTNQVCRALLLQMAVDDAENALDFVAVALDGGSDALFGVEEGKPGFLAKKGALARHLEMEPAEGDIFLFSGVVVERVRLVVGVDKIFEDCTRLV